jgi:hypothetical protein
MKIQRVNKTRGAKRAVEPFAVPQNRMHNTQRYVFGAWKLGYLADCHEKSLLIEKGNSRFLSRLASRSSSYCWYLHPIVH